MSITAVEPTYHASANNVGEWLIVNSSDPKLIWSKQGWIRIDDGVEILTFPSEIEALVYAQKQAPLHSPVSSNWSNWTTDDLLRKIAMPEGFVAELRKRVR